MKKLAIAVCNHSDSLNSNFFWNFNALFKPKDLQIYTFRGTSRIKSASLNEVTIEALKWGADYIFYMDYDISFPQDTIKKLLSHNLPVAGGLYHLKNTPYSPVAGWTRIVKDTRLCCNQNKKEWKFDFAFFPEGDENGLVKVEWTGIGCLMVKREVFDKIKWEEKKFYDTWNYVTGTRSYGHDVNFCFDCEKEGIDIFIDRTINCGHTGALTVDEDFIRAFYKSGMNMEWINQVKERKASQNYWDRMWEMEDLTNTTRTYPSEFDFYVNNILEKSRVAEVGCGIGYLLRRLKKEKKCEVYGYDFSPVAIRKLNEAGIKGEVQNLLKFNMGRNSAHSFDAVICSHVMEHFEADKHDEIIYILKALCKKDGRIFIGVPKFDPGYVDVCLEHKYEFNGKTFSDLLNKHFKKVYIGTVGHSYACQAYNSD